MERMGIIMHEKNIGRMIFGGVVGACFFFCLWSAPVLWGQEKEEEETVTELSVQEKARQLFETAAEKLVAKYAEPEEGKGISDSFKALMTEFGAGREIVKVLFGGGGDGKGMALIVAEKVVSKFEKQFSVSELEAEELLASKFDDKENLQACVRASKSFRDAGVELPLLLKDVTMEVEEGRLKKGMELEFAVRLMAAYEKMLADGQMRKPVVEVEGVPVVTMLTSLQKEDLTSFKGVFSQKLSMQYAKEGWDEKFDKTKKLWKVLLGTYVVADMKFTYMGDDEGGAVGVYYQDKLAPSFPVVKEEGKWKIGHKIKKRNKKD